MSPVPDASRWRDPAAYAYLETLIPSDLAWECLRRNPDYHRDFAATLAGAQVAQAARHLCDRWGLRFPGAA